MENLGVGFVVGVLIALFFATVISNATHDYEKRICQEWTQTECEKKWRPVQGDM